MSSCLDVALFWQRCETAMETCKKSIKRSGEQRLASAEELQQLRDWLRKIPYIDVLLCDDNFLQHYFVQRRGSLQETKEVIHNFFKSCLLMSKEFTLLDPARQPALDIEKYVFEFTLPKLTEDGSFITYHGIRNQPKFVENYAREVIIRVRRRMLSKILKFPPTINKWTVIFDFDKYSMETLSLWNMSVLREFITTGLKSIPYRVSAIHAINLTTGAQMAFHVMVGLLGKKYRDRVVIHPNLESLYKHVPKSILPSDLGGELGTRENMQALHREIELGFREKYLKWQESFQQNHGQFDDLIGKVDTSTFRKLELD